MFATPAYAQAAGGAVGGADPQALLMQFRCAKCDSWLHVTPRKGDAEALRCSCAHINVNLKAK